MLTDKRQEYDVDMSCHITFCCRLHIHPLSGIMNLPSKFQSFLPALTLTNRPYFLKPETPLAKGNPATPAIVRGRPGRESKISPLHWDTSSPNSALEVRFPWYFLNIFSVCSTSTITHEYIRWSDDRLLKYMKKIIMIARLFKHCQIRQETVEKCLIQLKYNQQTLK